MCFFFLSFQLTTAQNQKTKIPLVEILSQLERSSVYQFTYANEVVEGVLLVPPPINLSFKDKITYLEKKTRLIFQVLNDTFIAIKSKDQFISICGFIRDIETEMPLEAVAILGSRQQLITDATGYFKIKERLEGSIEIRYLGFKPIKLKVASFEQESCKTIYLEPDIESLSEVVLSNIFANGINKAANGSLNINFSNFGILPGLIETDVLQTIQALPGISSVNETVSDINIRGGTNDQNLILWDGIKMYQSGHFFGLISAFNPQTTNTAELIKNGTSVQYSDGVSGTIVMKTDRKKNVSLDTHMGSNFINADVFTDIPLGEASSIQLAARKAISDFANTPTYEKYFDRIEQDSELENFSDSGEATFDFYDTSLRWLFDLSEKDEIRANFIYANNELSFLESALSNLQSVSRTSKLEQNTLAAGLYYQRKWNSDFSTTLQVTNSEYRLGANNVDVNQSNRLVQVNKVEETSTKLNTWLNLNDRFSLFSGYQFVETAVNNLTDVDDPLFIRLVREVVREHAVYSEMNYKTDRIRVKLGARYSYLPKFNRHLVEPRLNVNVKISDALSLELLGEFKHQNSMQIINFQNDFFGIEKRRWFLSNDSSRPIIMSKQTSVGLNYSKHGWLFSAEAYVKNVTDIVAQSQGFLNQYIFSDAIGAYDVSGLDVLINKKLNNFSTWLSYSYAQNDYTFEDFTEVNFPNNLDIRHQIKLGAAYSYDKLKIAGGINWRKGIPTTNAILGNEVFNGTINYQAANSAVLDDYLRLDFSATYRFNLTPQVKAETGVSLWNLLNAKNTINRYLTLGENDQINEIKNQALALTPNFSFRVFF